ncbi:methyltransferase domain-containing protein [Streptomyces sp. HNM0575]|uniref:class I SAM-dependent methyltransferase n=1 Tax=Streptomyces sp. HNM0575 TaxID=2716338 RepID=UPI00145FB595|nr:methyltransferase domain-containing protein [Streptomyces sp. HNM0575]NLU74916.1 methyltransferase domain-containing protein [Streptomyces sp. HNM0575]
MTSETGTMLREFLRSPAEIGAVAPSSPRLAEAVTAPVPELGDPVVVELGPGTGVVTSIIEEQLSGRGHQLAVEANPRLADQLRDRCRRVEVLNADASKLPGLLAERGLDKADVVVSGLPWASFSDDVQREILSAVSDVLAPDGAFTTFGYIHALRLSSALRFRDLLHTTFEEVVPGRTVWRNLPPALVYHARRPRAFASRGIATVPSRRYPAGVPDPTSVR